MKRALRMSFSLILILVVAACSSGDSGGAETQEKFGVRMAKMSLWREAMFRFKRAVDLNPADALAHNNLAVAYEANGDFESAAREYREAIRLDKSNQFIQKNYSRFVEFNSRNKKRQPKAAAAAAAGVPASTGGAAPSAGGPAAPARAGETPPGPPSEGPATSAQPTGTAPAAIPPLNPPVPDPPPTKPPGGLS
ncbi:MAG: tetratricopeptide repeat protein [Thermoanaerobaculia bacterium]|nr:tetratricopeptide repeat protein [Thermoanaerobaculia bacterium]